MRILSWVHNKFSRSQEKRKSDTGKPAPDDRKEEFSDWPQSLLSIGTFGNTERREDQQKHIPPENLSSSQNLSDFSVDEVSKLQKELTKILTHKPKSSTDSSEKGGERANLPLDRFLNRPSSLEVDRHNFLDGEGNNEDLSPTTMIILSKAKDILADKSNAIKQKSLTFLLRKITNGFAMDPGLRDPLPESRMEKLLRTILHKKIHARGSNTMGTKKYLEEKPKEKIGYVGEMKEKEGDGSKWVKTDSEYIVLEI